MTERALSISTQIATPNQTSFPPAASISTNDARVAAESLGGEEEPYTIKCICDYFDDDGNTIYCETCDTWQHIECFYPGRVEDASRDDFDHSCADCKPRPLDRRHATERQRQRQNKSTNDIGDKKTKRPPSKSHKKKSKPSELQVNGYHDHDGHKNGSPQEHHPHSKKTKGHRSNQSINSQIKRSPPYTARASNHGHPPSPVHTPPDLPDDFQLHTFSDDFLTLYNTSQPAHPTTTNSFASLSVTNTMSEWVRDTERLKEDTGVKDREDVLTILKEGTRTETLKWPELRVERKYASVNNNKIQWRYLTTPTLLQDNARIAELHGLVGFQKDYCNDPENRWQEAAHPRPFIFFNPRLPLFIDTRQEGSICRYVRRSCRPNAIWETVIASGLEYHFWLISDRQISPNEQITIPWDFRFPTDYKSRFLHLLNLREDDGAAVETGEISDEEYEQLSNTIHLVLSDYGGCACDLGNDCAFARFHRNYHGKTQAQSNGTNGVKSKKGRKPKQHVSPTSTGHATNSRAASEGHPDVYDDDNRSVSGSGRSKPQSRDLTPLHGVTETNGVLTEPSDREKRKLAALEDSFRKLEQGPSRKKKRISDGANANSPVATTTQQSTSKPRQRSVAPRMPVSQPAMVNGNGYPARQYVDASTSRRQSGSPFSGISPTAAVPSPRILPSRDGSVPVQSRQTSIGLRHSYADASTQTDDVQNAWYQPKDSPAPKKRIVSLSKRLFQNRHRILQRREEAHQEQLNSEMSSIENQIHMSSPTAPMDLDAALQEDHSNFESPAEAKVRNASISSSTPSIEASSHPGDVTMPDAPVVVPNPIKPPPPPWAGHLTPAQRSPDLRVQMPATPNFSSTNHIGPLSATTTPSTIPVSPFGTMHFTAFSPTTTNGVAPSPAKKKMSLTDYKASRAAKNSSSGIRKSSSTDSNLAVPPASLKPTLSTIEETNAKAVLEGGSAVMETHGTEKLIDPVSSVDEVTTNPTTKSALQPETNSTL